MKTIFGLGEHVNIQVKFFVLHYIAVIMANELFNELAFPLRASLFLVTVILKSCILLFHRNFLLVLFITINAFSLIMLHLKQSIKLQCCLANDPFFSLVLLH